MRELPAIFSLVLCLCLLPLASCGPAATPTVVAAVATETSVPTETAMPTFTCTPAPTATPTFTPTATRSPTNTPTFAPTATPTNVPQPTNTATATPVPDYVRRGARQRYTFEQIVPLLSTPALVSLFMKNNVKWEGDYDNRVCGGNEYDPPWLVYQHGVDDCDGQAFLQCYLLEANGWNAYVIGLSIEGGGKDVCGTCPGHDACGVNLADGRILVLDNEGTVEGYFASLAEVAHHYIAKGSMWQGGSLRTMRASQLTQITTDYTTPKVTDLSWTFHEY